MYVKYIQVSYYLHPRRPISIHSPIFIMRKHENLRRVIQQREKTE